MTTLLLPASRFFLNVSNNAIQMNPSERYRLFPGKLTVSYQLSLIFRSMDQTHFPKAFILSGGNVEESKLNGRDSIICLAVRNQSIAQPSQGKIRTRKPVLSEGRDEDERFGDICPGCGVFLQNKDSNLPGYFQKRKVELEEPSENEDEGEGDIEAFEEVNEDEDEFTDENELGSDDEYEESDLEEGPLKMDDEFEWDSDEWESKLMEEEKFDSELAGFAPAGVGYGNITEELMKKARKKVSKSEKKRILRESQKEKEEVTVCARCHSLRNYGQVKNQTAENLIPAFDFDRLIVSRLMKPTVNANTTVVVMVVDCVDFDGSFPKQAVKSLFKALEGAKNDSKHSKNLPKLVLVATKVDLLPSQISPTRLDKWVRHRAKAGGAPKLSGVYLVSARKDLGVRNLLSFIKELAGPRGNVWVIGAQNAGKSTLINAFAKKEGARVSKLTEAPIPGTTLGILRIEGILSAKSKLYDTPGLLHPYLVSMRLNREEQKMVEIRKELQPRTYRIKVGQAVHVGGLMRLDLTEASVDTIYVTVWASPNVSLHLGKIENADEIMRKHAGIRLQVAYSELKMYENLVGGCLFIVDDMLENKIFVELQPPIGIDRAGEMDSWEEREFKVSGSSWVVNSIDIAAAGLGWLSLGLKGEASVRLWIYDGIEISLREPLILDRAPFLERPGFLLPKAISNAIASASGSKLKAGKPKIVHEEIIDSLSDLPV